MLGDLKVLDAITRMQGEIVTVSHYSLFGHTARIWDCFLSDSILITCGEDRTCRVWREDGSLLMVIREHIGRGIWRCIYDPNCSLLVTAGFDAAIRTRVLHCSSSMTVENECKVTHELNDQYETFAIPAPKPDKQHNLMDSKSEYIRCLRFTKENIVIVVTNNGYLYCVELLSSGESTWAALGHVSEAPVICMDLLVAESLECPMNKEDIVFALGDGKGNATILILADNGSTFRVVDSVSWVAEKERQLLGVHFSKSLGCRYIFTADPKGTLKLWNIDYSLMYGVAHNNGGQVVGLVASFSSLFGARIMCLDASIRAEVLICGDLRGNLVVFPLPNKLIVEDIGELEEVPMLDKFKGAHGISGVTGVHVVSFKYSEVNFRTTGGDGCICFFKFDKTSGFLEFIGMQQVKELSTIHSVVSEMDMEGFNFVKYAMGFNSADFILWDLINEIKILEIPCGGWRRPYSYYLGSVPDYQNCFAYLKDHTIHIRRFWIPTHVKQVIPQVLRMQSHGREIHSLCFISSLYENDVHNSWVATGCEDGTVRLTRYMPSASGSWCSSKLLGEHVGGSSVRSMCLVSTCASIAHLSSEICSRPASDVKVDDVLLISAGAKQVLTSWVLMTDISNEESYMLKSLEKFEPLPSTRGKGSLSFHWLSSHMPPKTNIPRSRLELLKITQQEDSSTKEFESNIMDSMENDWRYLAVTAFLVKHSQKQLRICFVVTSCSDATLTLRALLLPHRLWFDVALLGSQTCPVLALQHIVVAIDDSDEDYVHGANAHIIVSGATDGNISMWDVTKTVGTFVQFVVELQPELLLGNRKRPETGRGSQGGRLRRFMNPNILHKVKDDTMRSSTTKEASTYSNGSSIAAKGCAMHEAFEPQLDKYSSTIYWEVCQLNPMHVIRSAHRSGVNCLHVARLQSKSCVSHCVVSGGDDQALFCFSFVWTIKEANPNAISCKLSDPNDNVEFSTSMAQLTGCCAISIAHQDRIASAHSSAVKGIWTDGEWVFSTGLDQRVRCWKMGRDCKLSEYTHLIVSVPEPEALDATKCGRNRYQIAVAGRGMQVVEFLEN